MTVGFFLGGEATNVFVVSDRDTELANDRERAAFSTASTETVLDRGFFGVSDLTVCLVFDGSPLDFCSTIFSKAFFFPSCPFLSPFLAFDLFHPVIVRARRVRARRNSPW